VTLMLQISWLQAAVGFVAKLFMADTQTWA
jgi:hypothetical protein